MNKIEFVFEQLQVFSKKQMENPQAIKKFLVASVKNNRPITFFNWECPPRFLDKGKINYLVDLDKIFESERIDKFTELPRVVEQSQREIEILNFLNSLGIKYKFVKLIADTNLYYLTPESRQAFGEKEIKQKFLEFKGNIERKVEKYPCITKVILFSNFFRPFRQLYDQSFELVYKKLKNGNEVLSKDTIKVQITRAKEHVGIKNKKSATDFSFRTIATYAAEGIVFAQLTKTNRFSNCVWLNIEEVDDRTIQITNCLRRKKKIAPLPMLFL